MPWNAANHYDTLLRRTNVQALITSPSTVLANANYGYETTSSRLQTVSDGASTVSYTYYDNSPLIFQIDHTRAVERLRVQRQYDFLNRLQATVSSDGGTTVLGSYAYTYKTANQRQRLNLSDGSYWLYQYDTLGQLQSAKKYWPDAVPARPVRYGIVRLRLCAPQSGRRGFLRWPDEGSATTIRRPCCGVRGLDKSSPPARIGLL